MKDPIHIIHLGTSGFPYGFGAMQRIILMYRGLKEAGADVFVVNRKGRHLRDSHFELQTKGEFQGIPYVYTSGTPYKPDGFLNRNLQKVRGFWEEWKLLRQRKRSGQLDAAMVYLTGEFHYLLYYRMLTRLLRIPLVMSYVEYRSAFTDRVGWQAKWNDRMFDKYAARLADATLPISEYLIEKVKEQAPEKPYLKVPVLCDFDLFAANRNPEVRPYFLFVGAASYLEVIEFVASAYDSLEQKSVPLKLILGGSKAEIRKAKAFVKTLSSADNITLVPNVPHHEIPQHLANAAALLIPLRPGIQDTARFPHKVGEYLASGNPLITTAVGEMITYFEDETNALIAPEYSIPSFAEKMKFVVEYPDKAKAIGEAGLVMGKKEFDYRYLGKKMYRLLETLNKKERIAQ